MNARQASGDLWFLADGGEMGARMRAFDWSATDLGVPSTWPPALRFALDICLSASFPTSIYWGPDLRLLYNDAWAPIPSEKHPWALGRPAREVWSDIWGIVGPQLSGVLASGEGFATFDQMLPMKRFGRTEETWWNYSFTPIRDEQGCVVGVLNQGHETTAKVLAERARDSEVERLRVMFEQAPGAVAIMRGPEHIFEVANLAYLRLVGRRDIIGKRVVDVFPEAVGQGLVEQLDRVYHKGEPYIGAAVSVSLQRSRRGAPEDLLLDFIYQPTRDAFGVIDGVFAQATDVTERVRAENALRASEERLRQLNEELEARVAERTVELSTALNALQTTYDRMRGTFESSFIYQGYLHTDGTLLDSNAASLRGINATLEDVLGKPFWLTPWFSRTPGMSDYIQESVPRVARGESVRRTFTMQLADGEHAFDFSMRPVKNEQGDVVAIVPEGVDITPLLQTEEQLRQAQKMEAVGQLTGGIAHDFNNLLTGIIGSLDMMQRRIAQGRFDSVAQYAQAATTAANRAASLTHRLLAFSRRQPLEPKPVAANALISDMEELLRRSLGEKVQLRILTTGGLWLTRCDQNQLESSILNLAVNARDAMPDGGEISIETANAQFDETEARESAGLAAGQYVCIRVSDTGAGMPHDVLAKAFEPFFTTKPSGQGTGLGLSMIYGFVKQSEGYISIDSTPGAGTTVRMYLPRYRGEIESAATETSVTATYRALNGDTVLVVEDDPTVRGLILDVLGDSGYRVLEAQDGRAGLEILRSAERIDLLITDVGLPEMNGRQMVELAHQNRPDLRTLFITGYAEDATFDASALDRGAQLITKPFSVEALAQRIREMIGR